MKQTQRYGVYSIFVLVSKSRLLSFASPWTVVCQTSLSMGFPRQECWSELQFPSPGDLQTQESNLCLLYWQGDSLSLSQQGNHVTYHKVIRKKPGMA